MNEARRARLEKAGWEVTSVDEFLGLTPAESAIVEARLKLSKLLRERRQIARLSQHALAKRTSTSQSRVAKAEAAEPSISMDLMFRVILGTGATMTDIASVISETKAEYSEKSLAIVE